MKKLYKKLVLKIGTNVITRDDGTLDTARMQHIIGQVAAIKRNGTDVIMVSSGAMGAGRSLLTLSDDTSEVVRRQMLASIGQVKLMETYANLLKKHKLVCAQILATKEDFRDRMHYLNMKNCLDGLLHDHIIPIVNENDVVSVSELMFTDNDELAGLIASMMNMDALVIFTNVDGVYDGHPSKKESKVIPVIDSKKTQFSRFISPEKSSFGRGGMITKCRIAHKLSLLGITTHIVNGTNDDSLTNLLGGKQIGTTFTPHKKVSNVKKWIAHNEGNEKGIVTINNCAVAILTSPDKAASLLPVGVIKVEGSFEKGDLIRIQGESSGAIGCGIAQYSSKVAKNYMGKSEKKPLIHYDYLFLSV